MNPIAVTLLTGFLGAGKTTLLRHILNEQHGYKIAVIENEFGEVSVDDQLIGDRATQIKTLTNGCICCSRSNELEDALLDLLDNLDKGNIQFDRLVIECTGMADPGPIIQTFFSHEILCQRYLLDGVIALVDAVQTQVLYYEDAPAGTSYFAISNGRTEASEKVWGTALPYLVPVDSSTDTAADNYEYTLNLSAAQLQQLLAERLGIAADLSQQAQWFGTPVLTPSGYVDSLSVCGQTVQGTALRKALGLRSACFTVVCQSGTFSFTTRGYGHGVGMSQWGAKALAEQGADYRAILAHYYPGTELRR